ncbi:MAG: hypothetical protein M1281_19825 [Chloroflexi bacterium]|nr:hypothetical protein [Chloroflexota bacterium]
MLVLLPVAFLIVSALAILIIHWLRPEFIGSWLIAAVGAFLSWAVILFLRFRLPQQISLAVWQPVELFTSSPALVFDRVSWLYALSVATLAFAVILTATARGQYQTNVSAWAGSLILGGLGLLAVLAANPLTLVITWAALDLAELAIMLGSVEGEELGQRTVLAFAARVTGIFFILWAIISSRAQGVNLEFSSVPSGVGFFILLGAGLRLGVLPLHLPFPAEPRMRRGLGNILRLIPAASSLVILARLPEAVVPQAWMPYVMVLLVFTAVYGAAMWALATDELNGRPYWIISLAALALICVVRGDPGASAAWGTALLLSGGLLFLYSARDRRLGVIWLLGVWGFSGIPFSPVANGWRGLWAVPFSGLNLVFLVVLPLLLFGYIKHALLPGDPLFAMERWIQTIYPLGLLVLPVTHLAIAVSNWSRQVDPGIWWAGGVLSSLLTVATLWVWRMPDSRVQRILSDPSRKLLEPVFLPILNWITAFLGLEWLYRWLWAIFRLVGKLVSVITMVIEGDGGVLWALVFLALLISLIRVGANP